MMGVIICFVREISMASGEDRRGTDYFPTYWSRLDCVIVLSRMGVLMWSWIGESNNVEVQS